MTVIERLKLLRSQSKMTQTEFGNVIGMSQGNVSEMERGKFNPSIETIISACKYFKVSADWLLMGTSYDPHISQNADFFFENTAEESYSSDRNTGSAKEISETTGTASHSDSHQANTNLYPKTAADSDYELKQMYDVLKRLMQDNDPNLRGWAVIQFRRAFAEYCPGNADKGRRI